jgi:hypothetical protein
MRQGLQVETVEQRQAEVLQPGLQECGATFATAFLPMVRDRVSAGEGTREVLHAVLRQPVQHQGIQGQRTGTQLHRMRHLVSAGLSKFVVLLGNVQASRRERQTAGCQSQKAGGRVRLHLRGCGIGMASVMSGAETTT